MVRASIVLVAVLSLSCASSRVDMQGGDPDANYRSEWVQERALFVSAKSTWPELRGDFDGYTQLVGPDTITLPDASGGSGEEFSFGMMNQGVAWEIAYAEAELGAADFKALGFHGTYYWRPNEPIQPYLQFGIYFPRLRLENSSTDGMNVGNARLGNAAGLRFAAGALWFLTSTIAVDARAYYAFETYDEAEGVSGIRGDIDDPVEGDHLGLALGLTYFFPLGGSR